MGLVTAAGLALSAIGTGVAAFGQIQQARSAEKAGEFNARIAQQEADLKLQTTLENIRRKRADNRRFLARQNALFAAKGIAAEGSVLEVLGETSSNLELGIQDAFQQGQVGINQSLSQASLDRFNANSAAKAARTRAFGNVITGATKITQSLI